MSRSLQIGILAFLFVLAPSMVQAEESMPAVSLFCVPMAVIEKGALADTFPLTQGQETVFSCTVSALEKEKTMSVLLMGKQAYEKELPAATGTEVVLSGEPVVTTISFPVVYRFGTYQYTFSVIDLATKQEVGGPNQFVGVLKGEGRASIKDMSVDKEQYQWQDPVSLHLSLMIPEGVKIENEKLSLHVAVQNQQGGECVVLEDNRAVTEAEADYALSLPREESACTNALSVILKQDETVVDQRTLAVRLKDATQSNGAEQSGENIFSKIPKSLLIGIGLTVLFCLALAGYFLMRKERVRRF